MKKIVIAFLFIVLFSSAQAQSTGYAGKRFVIKTDILNGRFLGFKNVDLECALIRKLSLTFGVRYQSAKYKQVFNDGDYYYIAVLEDLPGSYRAMYGDAEKVRLQALTYKIQLKFYTNSYVSAPRGIFMYSGVEFGKAKLTNPATLVSTYHNGSNEYKPVTTELEVKDLKVFQWEYGFGFQEIFWERMAVEWTLGLNVSGFNIKGSSDSQRYTLGVAQYYGPNLLPIGKRKGSNGFSEQDDSHITSVGIAAYLKIGLLVF